ncbi:inositol monophosphatase family protein [Streptomyces sp. CB01580]|uniref:inositol monophosphatase family protein n=1 Tax=Streptomyces sp. CB01580 TaxID=1703933 RepID=UPI000B24E3D8|nr:inositol monophosphatase family protein [Streptomyces sp. CB01580]
MNQRPDESRGRRQGGRHDQWQDMRRVAQEAVDAGVHWLMGDGTREPWTRARLKPSGEEVTAADIEVERRITRVLEDCTPEIPVVGEESAHPEPPPSTCWLLDPIDGTMNFTRGAPGYALSLAYVTAGTPVLGVIHAPRLGRRWSTGEADATLPAMSDRVRTLSRAVVGLTGAGRRNPRTARLIGRLYTDAYRVRLQGAMSLDLAAVAEGWLDACVCLGPKPWDVAAGTALVRERGGVVLGEDARDFTLRSPVLAAGSPPVARRLIALWESTAI